jgi:phosphate starvation-inducible PhoH-like protein
MEEFREIYFDDIEAFQNLAGQFNENLTFISDKVGVHISSRGNRILLYGEPEKVEKAEALINSLYELILKGNRITRGEIEKRMKNHEETSKSVKTEEDVIFYSYKNKKIMPKSPHQKEYVKAIEKYDIVFAIGPAGTGKTYLSMAMAVKYLKAGYVDRIILTRPAVEAGEKLGYLPGDIQEKVNPYLRPLYDALHDMLEFNQVSRLLSRGIIEIAPLAFMRGRTLNSAFIILDEAQNTTSEQMKMFLTRLGFDSKAVITGDITQIDLPKEHKSGLIEAQRILSGIPEIKFIYFDGSDVVRHPLVQEIIKAYDENEKRR